MHKRNISKLSLGRIGRTNLLGVGSILTLAVLSLTLISPTVSEETHASEYCMGDNGYVECDTTAKMDTYARVASVVSLSVQSNVVMDVVPKANGTVIETPVKLTVATNSAEGYSLYMKTMNDTNALVNLDTSTKSSIAPITGTVTAAELANQDNVWGYALSDQTTTEKLYQAVPLTQDKPIYVTNSLVEGEDELDLSFGLNVTTSLPAGTYNNAVLVSAVANPVTITNLSELVFMQDMTPEICANTTLNPDDPITKQLIDTRDGKSYWVAKLRDGNCWMTQNLALDLSTEKTLMPSDTDLVEGSTYTPKSNTESGSPTERVSQTGTTRSWNPGMYALAIAQKTNWCTEAEMSECNLVQDISDWNPTYDAAMAEPNSDGQIILVNADKMEYDAHYLLGNYYQQAVATAETEVVNGYVTGSICPKGWTLPRGDVYGGGDYRHMPRSTPYSIYDLSLAYGFADYTHYILNGTGSAGLQLVAGNVPEDFVSYVQAPFYAASAGMFAADSRVGNNSAYWTKKDGYNVLLTSTQFYPVVTYGRSCGFSVRCLAR